MANVSIDSTLGSGDPSDIIKSHAFRNHPSDFHGEMLQVAPHQEVRNTQQNWESQKVKYTKNGPTKEELLHVSVMLKIFERIPDSSQEVEKQGHLEGHNEPAYPIIVSMVNLDIMRVYSPNSWKKLGLEKKKSSPKRTNLKMPIRIAAGRKNSNSSKFVNLVVHP